MTDRERAYAAAGFEYAEGIELANVVIVPTTGREVRKTDRGTGRSSRRFRCPG